QYYPWNEHKSYASVLATLEADIICLQEMKITRSGTDSDLALPTGFDSFFTYPKRRHGYSGTTTYVRSGGEYTPVDAEEGFTGLLCRSNGIESNIGGCEKLWEAYSAAELMDLDSEGRVIITDHKLFVLINAYFPVGDPSEDRRVFRKRYYDAMRLRVEGLIAAGREVILVGDINTTHNEIDHCDPAKSMKELGISVFHDTHTRTWIRDFTYPRGPMVDTFRWFWPDQERAFTCWNTLLNCRPVNYGTRIDYILATHALMPWFITSTVDANIMGSDHCPVSAVLHDVNPVKGLKLMEAMGYEGVKRDPPRLCAKYWDEFSGRQVKLNQFFNKKQTGTASSGPEECNKTAVGDAITTVTVNDSVSSSEVPQMETHPANPKAPATSETPNEQPPLSSGQHPSQTLTSHSRPTPYTRPSSQPLAKSRQAAINPSQKSKRKTINNKAANKVPGRGQSTLRAFFGKGNANDIKGVSQTQAKEISTNDAVLGNTKPDYITPEDSHSQQDTIDTPYDNQNGTPSDIDTISQASQSQPSSLQSGCEGSASTPQASSQWRSLLAPPLIPTCYHNEPAKAWTVNKPGKNQGRMFYLCNRPVGVEGTKGKRIVGEFRCDFFMWKKGGKGKGGGSKSANSSDVGAKANTEDEMELAELQAQREAMRAVPMHTDWAGGN
ncbi:Endonuclease/exonuclease/phosphatase, partial [Phlyctochytrium arcticum]